MQSIYTATVIPVPASAPPSQAVSSAKPTTTYHIPSGASQELDGSQIKSLTTQGFTDGFAKSLATNTTHFPLRIFVIDNSGSMQTPDGHRIVVTGKDNNLKMVDCTRWEEIRETVTYHIQMAGLIQAQTSFRLLNNPGLVGGKQKFDVATVAGDEEMSNAQVNNALNIMTTSRPTGATPLTRHISDIHAIVQELTPALEAEGKKVSITIATDGLPTNSYGECNALERNQFVQSLKRLEGLPVWLVIRLCTDEDEVVDFYNELDDQLELSMDVLDDFVGEAKEVYEHNTWLNYALPIHRMREMGYYDRVFDMLDERTLMKGELRDFCRLLFGVDSFDGVPDPAVNWDGFYTSVSSLLQKEQLQYNPIHKKMMPWIDLKRLNQTYSDQEGCVCTIM